MSSQIEKLYQSSSPTHPMRATFVNKIDEAKTYYQDYLSFLDHNLPKGNVKLLDAGCGEGWSTLFLKQKGIDVVGMDLKVDSVEAKTLDPDLKYVVGSACDLPFDDNSFDAVSMYQVFGHLPNPEKGLEECMRVLRPGGRLIVVSPNLINFVNNARFAIKHTLRCLKSGKLWETRQPGMQSHPGGNTMPESWKYTFLFFYWTIKKWFGEKPPNFIMREPDTTPPFHANNDVCHYSNPLDIVNWATMQPHVKVIRKQRYDSLISRLTWMIRGTWVVLEKQSNES